MDSKSKHLETSAGREAAERGVAGMTDREAAARLAAILSSSTDLNSVDWTQVACDVALLAETLESTVDQASSPADANARLETATMLRVRAEGDARKGTEFDWEERDPDVAAPMYRISQEQGGYAVTIAGWDEPDWWFDSRMEAKRFCEEVRVRPAYPAHLRIVEWMAYD